MTRIFLVGYMGVGKTTYGRMLASALGLQFYDLDHYISQRRQRTISQIFSEKGADGFRLIERNLLHEVAEFEDVVVSCGGGTPCFFDNMDYLNAQGTTIYLKAPADFIINHLLKSATERPLLAGKTNEELGEFVRSQLKEREIFYNKSKHIVDVSAATTRQEISECINEMVKNLNL